jgi:hypothetical protein
MKSIVTNEQIVELTLTVNKALLEYGKTDCNKKGSINDKEIKKSIRKCAKRCNINKGTAENYGQRIIDIIHYHNNITPTRLAKLPKKHRNSAQLVLIALDAI